MISRTASLRCPCSSRCFWSEGQRSTQRERASCLKGERESSRHPYRSFKRQKLSTKDTKNTEKFQKRWWALTWYKQYLNSCFLGNISKTTEEQHRATKVENSTDLQTTWKQHRWVVPLPQKPRRTATFASRFADVLSDNDLKGSRLWICDPRTRNLVQRG